MGPFENGLSLFDGGHYRGALGKFIRATDRAPRGPQRWWDVTESYRILGETSASAHAYRVDRQIRHMAPAFSYAVATRQTLEPFDESSAFLVEVPIQ